VGAEGTRILPKKKYSDMTRREALSRAAVLLGGAVSAPVVTAVLGGCRAEPSGTLVPAYLSREQSALVDRLCDIILPQTSTPSATAAGVPSFIHAILQDASPEEGRKAFVSGLAQLDREAGGFLGLAAGEQESYLRSLDEAARAAGSDANPAQAAWRQLKELTIVGYFTSEVGAGEVLEYVPVPGRYEPCISLPEGQRAYAT
jgi:gluconate 2-dehydrogenase gamma chain